MATHHTRGHTRYALGTPTGTNNTRGDTTTLHKNLYNSTTNAKMSSLHIKGCWPAGWRNSSESQDQDLPRLTLVANQLSACSVQSPISRQPATLPPLRVPLPPLGLAGALSWRPFRRRRCPHAQPAGPCPPLPLYPPTRRGLWHCGIQGLWPQRVSELHVALRAPLRRQAADRAHAALVVDAEVQRERGQHHHRREVQEDDVGVRGDLHDGGARGSIRRVK